MISNIQFLPDLLRNTRAFAEGFYDLVREPILQGCGIQAGASPESRFAHWLKPGFSVETFRELSGWDESDIENSWLRHYFALPTSAADYLLAHLPADTLILSFEMPPWLSDLLDRQQIPYLDIRVSPLRFGRDLYIALRTHQGNLRQRLQAYVVSAEELRLEAAALAASVRMHQQRLEESGRYPLDLDNTLVYIGQAPYDASLLSDKHSTALRCTDFADQLRELAQGRRLLHKAHPFAADFAKEEQRALAEITGQAVGTCYQNAYQLLSCAHDVELVGISSGMLQEASWFGKQAHTLFRPVVPLPLADTPLSTQDFLQVHFEEWLSPGFWHAVLTPEKPAPRLLKLPTVQHHHARQSLDQWWDYAKVMTWEKSLPIESFERTGGILLRQRIEALEQGLLQNRSMVVDCDEGNEVYWPSSARMRGKITIRGRGNRVIIDEQVDFDATIDITGDHNGIVVDRDVRIAGKIYASGSGGMLRLGAGSTFTRVIIKCHEGRNILIGRDCMFSNEIELRTTDGHAIVDPETGMRLNPAQDIVIGDHVWVGKGVTILKGGQIPGNTIVGADSLVNGIYTQSQTLLAGKPARIIKEHVTWQRELKNSFSQAELEAWKRTPAPAEATSPTLVNDDWERAKQLALEKFAQQPQAFGRGQLYQGHEAWALAGQRPTLSRLQAYGLDPYLLPEHKVLDIGCNLGLMGMALSPRIARYHGIDSNPALIEIARILAAGRGIKNCEFQHCSFNDLMQTSPEPYDMVLSFAVHVWIGLPMAQYAAQLKTLLKPGGTLIIESNNLASNDQSFFSDIQVFLDHGYILQKQGMLKDDGIIERGFCIFRCGQ
ncbi:methyltransferase domain-containing protein [Methylovorus mays]|uniref:methyltransferase domain-containing protein n=1 Tax=Methylovorus mays TaxID=184077 RepID=UPI001E4FA418|nr:methyltransferase domain-containing protein [Methylovorus mays]MCB5208276.1 methyltransferase domain-containing protein [Methylovorus mays]